MKKPPQYIPALHFHWLTRWYDPVMQRLFPESGINAALIAQAGIQPGQTVLDVGCGTGTLTLLIKQVQPNATVHGLDIDAEILHIRNEKPNKRDKPFCYSRVWLPAYLIRTKALTTCLPVCCCII